MSQKTQSQTTTSEDAPCPEESSDDTTGATPESQAIGMSDAAAYRCPICQATYEHELLARVHVTRADDDAHDHRNGLMPETEIKVLDANGNMVATVTRSPDELDPSTLTVDDFPEELSEKRRHALLVAAQNPYETSAQEIKSRLDQRADETDVAVPGYRTVCRALTSFYQPDDGTGTGSSGESLAALTAKQQAIVIARLAEPDASEAQVAQMVGCASSYPGQVEERAGHVINRLQTECEAGRELTAVIADELTASDIETLHEQGLVVDLPVQMPAVEAEHGESAEGGAETNSEEAARTIGCWGSPVENATRLQADPADPFGEEADTASAAATAAAQSAGTENDVGRRDSADTRSGRAGGDNAMTDADLDADADIDADAEAGMQELVGEIELLHQQVAFMINALRRIDDPDPSTARMLAVAQQVRDECAAMLPPRRGA